MGTPQDPWQNNTFRLGPAYRHSDHTCIWHIQDYATFLPTEKRWVRWSYSGKTPAELKEKTDRHRSAQSLPDQFWDQNTRRILREYFFVSPEQMGLFEIKDH